MDRGKPARRGPADLSASAPKRETRAHPESRCPVAAPVVALPSQQRTVARRDRGTASLHRHGRDHQASCLSVSRRLHQARAPIGGHRFGRRAPPRCAQQSHSCGLCRRNGGDARRPTCLQQIPMLRHLPVSRSRIGPGR